MRKYTQMLSKRQNKLLADSGVGVANKLHSYTIALNGLAARMSHEQAQKVARMKGVARLIPDEFDSARDDNGHGTHTASTAAGNAGVAASIFGNYSGVISGIATRA